MLRELKREHHITYLALVDDSSGQSERMLASEYCHELICVPHTTRPKFSAGFYVELAGNLLSGLPYFMKKYQSSKMTETIESLLKRDEFDVLVCDFLQPSVNIPDRITTPTVLFQHNVEAMIWKRHYEVQSNPFKKKYLYNQWMKSRRYEQAACRRFDMVVTVSDSDEKQLRDEYGVRNVAAIPTGVDIDYFSPQDEISREPNNIVFTGSMDWLPNEDGMQYFIREVLPAIRQKLPATTLTVVGRDPYPSLIDLSKSLEGIEVTGRVDDVRPYIARASVFIVPIRIGGGTRLKIYEAMAMGTPVVSTTVGAEGLPLESGKDLLIADTPADLAGAVTGLLTNPQAAREMGFRSAKLMQEHYAWKNVARVFANVCDSAVASGNGHR